MKRARKGHSGGARMREDSDRTILVAGFVVAAIVALASLFSPVPGRMVEKVTGIGAPPPPSVEARAHNALRTGQYDKAVELFRKSSKQHPEDAATAYHLACALSMAGDTAAAMEELRRAVDLGFADSELLRRDEDLEAARTEEASFGAVLTQVVSLDPRHQLDFLKGAWEVCEEDGTRSAQAEWVRWHDGRLFVERRKGSGFRSTWFYAFHADRKVWVARAVTDGGIAWELEGAVKDGVFTLEGTREGGDGRVMRVSYRAIDEGKVERRVESPAGDGTWRTDDSKVYVPTTDLVWEWESD